MGLLKLGISYGAFRSSAIALLIGSVSLLNAACQKTASSPPPPTPIQYITLEPSTLEESTEFVGNLEATQIAQVNTEIQGRITEVRVTPGQYVEAGTVLMVISPNQAVPQLESAQASVNAASAARDAAQEQLRVAEANRDTAQSQVELAETNFERAEFLLEAGAIGEFDYDRAAQDLEAKRNGLRAATDQVSAAQAAIAQAAAAIAQAQGQADAARVAVDFQQVTAPIAGTLGDISVKVGDLVTTGQVVTQVAQNNALDINISIPSNRSGQLRPGLVVELFDPNTNDQLGTGQINFISPTVDPTAQVILSKARFSNATGMLRHGQYVRARVIWETQPGVLVPTVAIARQSGREFVYLVDEDTTESGEAQEIVRFSPVELGDLQGSSFQVIEGLEEGDRVAVTNILKLRDGVPVKPEEAPPKS